MNSFPHYRWAKFRKWNKDHCVPESEKPPISVYSVLLHPMFTKTGHYPCSIGAVRFLANVVFTEEDTLQDLFFDRDEEYQMKRVVSLIDVTLGLTPKLGSFCELDYQTGVNCYWAAFSGVTFVAEMVGWPCNLGGVRAISVPQMILTNMIPSGNLISRPTRMSNPKYFEETSLVFRVVSTGPSAPFYTVERNIEQC